MAESFYTILTNIGLAAIANAQVTQSKVDFATFVVGDGNGAYYNPTSTQASLVNEVWRGPISGISVDENNANWVIVEAVIPSIAGGFNVREIGVLDSAGQLLAVGKVPETYKPITAEGSLKDLYLRMILEVSNASVITLKVDPAVIFASKKYVDDKDDVHANIKATTAQYGHTMLLDSVTSTSNVLAATPKSVKTAYDKAVAVETSANNHAKDTVLHTYYGTAGGSANAKTVTLSPAPTSYVDGMAVVFKNTTANTGAVTLNVNNLGVKAIVKANGKALSANNLSVNGIYTARYNSTTGNFILQGEGGVDLPSGKFALVDEFSAGGAIGTHITNDGKYLVWVTIDTFYLYNLETSTLIDTKSIYHGSSSNRIKIVSNSGYIFTGIIGNSQGQLYKYDIATKTLTNRVNSNAVHSDLVCDENHVYTNDYSAPNFVKLNVADFTVAATITKTINTIYAFLDELYLYLVSWTGLIQKFNKNTMQLISTGVDLFSSPSNALTYTHRFAIDKDYIYIMTPTDSESVIYKVSKTTLTLVATSTSSYFHMTGSDEYLITKSTIGSTFYLIDKSNFTVKYNSPNFNPNATQYFEHPVPYLLGNRLIFSNYGRLQGLFIT